MNRLFSLIVLLGFSASVAAAAASNVVKIGNGVNSVDFTGDGITDMVVLGHRENFNAHSFDVVSFYILADPKAAEAQQWEIVPIAAKNKEQLSVTVSGGADCVLHDFRLLAGSGKRPASLILADRAAGTSFADPATVTFTYFVLQTSTDGIPGLPRYSFAQTNITRSKAHYCDVGDAFQKELGIGSYSD